MSQPSTTTTTTTAAASPSSPPNLATYSPQPHPFRPIFLTLLVACPVLTLLPPRKVDLYTFTLGGAWIYSATELAYSHPRRVRLQQQAQLRILNMGATEDEGGHVQSDDSEKKLGDEQAQREETETGGVSGLFRKLWMGDEKAGWQKRRLEREKEELESGKGYGDLIMEQIREVFPGFGGGGRRGEEEGNGSEEGHG